MEVTPATEDDVPALSELLGVLFQQEADFRPDPERQSAGLRAILGREDVGQVLVLRDGPAAVGMVSLLFLPSTALGGRVAVLEDMVVRPDARGGGAGSRLLAAAADFARSAMIPMRLLLGGQRHVEPGTAADGGGRSAFPG